MRHASTTGRSPALHGGRSAAAVCSHTRSASRLCLCLFVLGTLTLLPMLLGAQSEKSTSEESLLLGEIPSVFGASRFNQAVTEAPASVSVISSDEIAAYGWRTLADLLKTVRGFYISNDRSYAYVGTRGFSRPGDYNSRVLVLVDGTRANENIFGGGYVGRESLVEMATVERVEVIRGPASSLYGSSAFFGIINVVTKRGRAQTGVRATAEMASFGAKEAVVSGGARSRHGIEFFASAGSRRADGQDFYYPEFDSPPGNFGRAINRDREAQDRLFAKLEWRDLSLEGALNSRLKVVPTASYGTAFNVGQQELVDNSKFLTLRYQPTGAGVSTFSGSVSLNHYDFRFDYPFDSATTGQDLAVGRWAITEWQYTRTVRGLHRLILGGMYTHNFRQEQTYAERLDAPLILSSNDKIQTVGVFALTELRLHPKLIFNGGFRYDNTTRLGGNFNPRAALIYKLGEGSAIKALYGNAYRAPNNFERFYDDNGRVQKGNPSLDQENITTYELLVEKLLSRKLKAAASVYRYQARQLIDQNLDPADSLLQYRNTGQANGQGIETEVEVDFGVVTGRGSYALQRARIPTAPGPVQNSPTHIAALNVAARVLADRATVALEVRGMSSRHMYTGDRVPGYAISNVVLSSRRLYRGIELTGGVYNALNASYSDPVSEEHRQSSILQDKRNFRLSVGYAF